MRAIISSKEFNTNQGKYFDLVVNEDLCIKNGEDMFHLICNPVEITDKKQIYFEPDIYFKAAIHLLLFFSCFCYAQTVFCQSDSLSIETFGARKAIAREPVVPFYDTLFYINANVGSFSAKERAASITEKIKTVSKESGFHRDSIKVVASGNIVEIDFGDIVIMGITSTDSQAAGKSQLALANEYKQIIGEAIDEYKQKNDWKYILIHVGLALLIVAAQYFLIKLVNKLFRRISKHVVEQSGKKIKPVKLKSYNLIDEERAVKLILSGIKIVRYLVIGILLYLTIPLIFSVFPPTRSIGEKLFGYVLNPLQKILAGITGYIPNLITIIIIVFVFRYLIRGLRYFAGEINKGRLAIKGFYSDWAYPTFNIVKTLLYAFMFIVIFPYLPGSNSPVFQGVSVFIGIVFSLGSSSVIGNVVSGLVLTYMRPFKVGDRIKIGDIVGNVIEKTPFVTRIRTPKNEEVTIPNSNVMSAQTFNYTHSAKVHGLILHTKVTFGYDVPWRKVHQLLLEAAARTSNIMKSPKPFVLQTALDDFYVEYQINVATREADKTPVIYTELYQNILDVFNEAGIEIMSPSYTAHRDGSQVTIPSEYLPDDYQVPSFNVKVENAGVGEK